MSSKDLLTWPMLGIKGSRECIMPPSGTCPIPGPPMPSLSASRPKGPMPMLMGAIPIPLLMLLIIPSPLPCMIWCKGRARCHCDGPTVVGLRLGRVGSQLR